MKITVLMENTTSSTDLVSEHGLSLFIETDRYNILFDMGQSGAFVDNAAHMGIDLQSTDFAVLSHGHYDHGGGIRRFLELVPDTPIYLSRYAFEPHYNGSGKYIGLDPALRVLPRLKPVEDVFEPLPSLMLLSCHTRPHKYPIHPFGLSLQTDSGFIPDDFRHEIYLLLTENDKRILISGCSHKGILNIMDWLHPDILVGGFHFTKLDPAGEGFLPLTAAAEELQQYDCRYYTCHCTGCEQYSFLRSKMGEQLRYIATGQVLTF